MICLTLALLPLAPVPLELQRRLLDDAVANKDVSLLIWLSTLYIVALLPQFVMVPIFQARMNRLAQEKAFTMRELGDYIVDNAEPDLLNRPPPEEFTTLTDRILRLRTRFLMTKNIMETINNLLILLGPFGVIAWGGYMVIQGEVEVGVILAFVSGLERLCGPIRELVGSYSSITDARMRYRILLGSFPKGIDPDGPEPMPNLGKIG